MVLELYDGYDKEKNEVVYYDFECRDHGFFMRIDRDNKLEDYLNNPSIFYDYYKNEKFLFDNKEYSKKELHNEVLNSEYVMLDFGINDINDYIDKHEFLKNKKIILKNFYEITDKQKLLYDIDKYSKHLDQIYVILYGNRDYVHILEALETMEIIEKKALEIKSLNLSPIETVMYAYDIVRNREYIEEKEGEDKSISRDLTKVLKGKEIVCEGFTGIADGILTYLGFNVTCVNINRIKGGGHQRFSVYIKDDKYGIDGVYYFDPTWESKEPDETNEFLNKYIFFGRTKKQIETLSQDYFTEFELLDSTYESLKNYLIDSVEKEVIDVTSIANTLIDLEVNRITNYRNINKMSAKVNRKFILKEYSDYIRKNVYNDDKIREATYKLIDEVKKIFEKFKHVISTEKMIQILNNVRKVEHSINPNFYPYDMESLRQIAYNSFWLKKPKAEEELMYRIFGEKSKSDIRFDEIVKEYGIDKDIEESRKTKVLK